jgi:hypothetical protein
MGSQPTWEAIIPKPPALSKPSVTFIARKTLLAAFGKFVPLLEQFPDVQTNVGHKLELALEALREKV